MLKYSLLLLLLIFICLRSKGQARYYLDENNQIVSSPSKAIFYIVVEEDKVNSIWKVHQYTFDDSLAMIGSFKDSKLQIPHGKFTIYATREGGNELKYNSIYRRIDTLQFPDRRFIQAKGSFFEGKKDGEWEYFSYDGLGYSKTFKDDKLNGRARSYSSNGEAVLVEGNYINDVKEGLWLTFGAKGTVLTEDLYKNGQIQKTVSHVEEKQFRKKYSGGEPNYNFHLYLSKVLRKTDFGKITGTLRLSFTLTKEGKLVNPNFYLLKDITDKMLVEIINAIIDAPSWKPLYVNDVVSEGSIMISISLPDKKISVRI